MSFEVEADGLDVERLLADVHRRIEERRKSGLYSEQELRFIAQSMAEVAVRLAEPETFAHDSVVSVGQAVRREVAAMGDGVERALARASELETMVNNEVNALFRPDF